jgi:hypothetical protein
MFVAILRVSINDIGEVEVVAAGETYDEAVTRVREGFEVALEPRLGTHATADEADEAWALDSDKVNVFDLGHSGYSFEVS